MNISKTRHFATAIIVAITSVGSLRAACTTNGSTTTCTSSDGPYTFQEASGTYTPYGSTQTVSGVNGPVTGVTVTLTGVSSTAQGGTQGLSRGPHAMLVAPDGSTNLVFFAKGCNNVPVANINFTFSDAAANQLVEATTDCHLGGTFKPFAGSAGTVAFPGPAPTSVFATTRGGSPGATLNGQFAGMSAAGANGGWKLYLTGNTANSLAATVSSWSLGITFQANATATNTAVSSNLNPSFTTAPNNSVTLTATVSPAPNGGTVTFKDGSASISCTGGSQTITTNTATCVTTFAQEGAHHINAIFSGSGNFAGSTSSSFLQVTRTHTTVQAGAPANTFGFCNTGGITIPEPGGNSIDTNTPAPAMPYSSEIFVSGLNGTIANVDVYINGFSSAQNIGSNSVGMLLASPAPNSKNLDFFWIVGPSAPVNNASFVVSDNGATQLPNQGNFVNGTLYKPASYTTGGLTAHYCQSATCDGITVSDIAPNPFTSASPEGLATMSSQFDGLNPNGTWQLFTVMRAPAVTATVSSWCLNFTVSNGVPTTTTVSGSPDPSFTGGPGSQVNITATISNQNSSVNEGSVIFIDGQTNIACTNAGGQNVVLGQATCQTTFTKEGAHHITASYSGTANFGPSNGNYTQQVDNPTTLTVNNGIYSYCNAGPWNIPAGGANQNAGPSGPYPEHIFVNNLPGTINHATISLNGYSSNFPTDLTMMLVGPCQSLNCTPTAADGIDFFSHAGGVTQVSGQNLVFADAGINSVGSPVSSGTYKPTSGQVGNAYGAPAPTGPYQYAAPAGLTTLASVYANHDGNGTWSFYGASTSNGSFATITGNPAVCLNFTENPPDLSIAKSHSGNFRQGDTGRSYSITVANHGPGPTGGTVTVTDSLPAGLTARSISGTNWTCTNVPANGAPGPTTLTCVTTDVVAASASYPALTLVVDVPANAPGNVTNSATVAGSLDNTPANNTANDATTIIPASDMTITKTHSGVFTQGDVGRTYTITVTNSGAGPTLGTTTVVENPPVGLALTGLAGTGWTCDVSIRVCTISSVLNSGQSYNPITATFSVASNAPPSVTNSSTVSGGGELNTANDTATDITTIVQAPDLTVSKGHSGNFFQGQTGAQYTLTVLNSGAGPVLAGNTVTVVDTLPAGMTAAAISGTGWNCLLNTLTCTRSDALAASASYPAITLTVNVSQTAPALLVNTATVSGGGEVVTNNNAASDSTTINAAPTVTSFKVLWGTQSFDLFTSTRVRLPWQISSIQVSFSANISSADILSLSGLTATGVTGLGTNILTFTINPISIGAFSTQLAQTGVHAVKDSLGTPIAAFTQNFKVLWGDFNDDGVVSSADMTSVNNARAAPYTQVADMDGNGAIQIADVTIVRSKIGTAQP